MRMEKNGHNTGDLYDPTRWGLPAEAVVGLGERLRTFWMRYRPGFRTKTRDSSGHAWTYLRGLLSMETKRNFANIARRVVGPHDDGQKLQHFMTDSPWSAQAVIQQVQREIAATPGLATGGVLILDESADERAGAQSAGAGRQYNGRLGKVEMSQVGVFLAFYKDRVWTWVDGELYLPEHWFSAEMAQQRERVGVPPERTFATKIELGWRMIQRVQANGLPFEAVICDDFYGQSGWFRQALEAAQILYMAEVPEDTHVYLEKPDIEEVSGQEKPSGPQPVTVRAVAQRSDTHFQRVRVRSTERGDLNDPFAFRRVWTIRQGQLVQEWLVIRHEHSRRYTYALSNAPDHTPLERLAWLKSVRYFVERSHQDAKSEIGWDELQAVSYRAWEHHVAMTILATWFIAQTKYEWAVAHPGDPSLAHQLELEALPALSVANVRQLLQAVMPLPQLSPEEATRLVVQHLLNRSRSTRSRLRAQRKARGPT